MCNFIRKIQLGTLTESLKVRKAILEILGPTYVRSINFHNEGKKSTFLYFGDYTFKITTMFIFKINT